MPSQESGYLAEWSRAVRESSLKRLRVVPEALVNWRPAREAMSFADLAQHLIDADFWLFEKLKTPELAPMVGRAGLAGSVTGAGFRDLIARLHGTGEQRAELIAGLSQDRLSGSIPDARFGGPVTVWWVIVRGNLDHEAHHRGQLAIYIRLVGAGTNGAE